MQKIKDYDLIYVKFENQQNQSMMIEVRTMVTSLCGVLFGKGYRESSKVLEIFSILIWGRYMDAHICKTASN